MPEPFLPKNAVRRWLSSTQSTPRNASTSPKDRQTPCTSATGSIGPDDGPDMLASDRSGEELGLFTVDDLKTIHQPRTL